MRWISSNGGPLLLLEERLLPDWSGADTPRDGRAIDARFRLDITAPGTDYDRACSVAGSVGLITVGDGAGLVLAGAPLDTAWVPSSGICGDLVRWEFADDDGSVLSHIEHLRQHSFPTPELDFKVSGTLRLFDSAMPGHEIVTSSDEVMLVHGRYSVATLHYSPDDRTSLVVHRVERVG